MSDEDDDERGVAPIPLLPPPPAGPVDGSLDLGRVADLQRAQPPSAEAQRLQSGTQHDGGHHLGRDSFDPQRAQPNLDPQRAQPNLDPQRAQPNLDPQRAQPDGHAPDVQRAAENAQRGTRTGRARSLRHLRPRTRFFLASAAAIVAGGGTVLIVNAAQDDSKPAAAPTTTVVVTVATTDPATTAAAPTTEDATVPAATAAPTTVTETTAAETTVVETTLVPTTLVPTTLAPSVAGLYTVTVSDSQLTSSVTGTITLPSQVADVWQLEGPCDGIGTCTMSLASAALGGGAAPTSGAITIVVMSPSGPGAYSGTQDLTAAVAAEGANCGAATAEFNVTYGAGAFSGTYLATFSGAADCPPFTVSANYAGTLNA